MQLRPYQSAALEALRAAFRRPRTRVVLYSPTGSGKTLMAMEMIKAAQAKGSRVMFVCNRIGLVEQASAVFESYGIPHGIVQGSNTRDMHFPVLVASIKTLDTRGYPPVDLIVIDEAHAVAGSRSYLDMLEVYNAVRVVGLTATPFSKGLGRVYPWGTVFEEIVVASTIPTLISQGHLVDVDIFSPSEPDLSQVRVVAGEYHQEELGKAVDKPVLVGDIVAHWKRLANGKPTVCFATNIPHSKHIVEQFKAAGISAEHVDCYTPEDERKEILKRVDTGRTTVISNVSILAEGWDQPSVQVMICARPTKSLIRWIQMAGRILRPYPGKHRGLILDHSGSAKELGYPTDELPILLDDGKPKEASDSKPPEKLPKVCPSCAFLKPVGVHACPRCGFAPEKSNAVSVEAGELTKLERQKGKLKTLDKAKLFAELKTIAKQKNWSSGRLSHVFRDITGVWPNHYVAVAPLPPSQDTINAVRHLAIKFAKSRQKSEERPTP